jgi:hypothetical protein
VKKTHDYVHYYRGYWSDGDKCRICIYTRSGAPARPESWRAVSLPWRSYSPSLSSRWKSEGTSPRRSGEWISG